MKIFLINHLKHTKQKIKYVYYIIISKNNEVYLTVYEPKKENSNVFDDKKIIELYENEKDIFDEEIEKITKSFFG